MSTKNALTVFLDTLLPGGEGFPSASDIGLAGWIGNNERFAATADDVVARLPEGFAGMGEPDRVAAMTELERAEPTLFGAGVVAAYSGYYTHADVLAAIEARCGYKAQPPQPGGYALSAFDPSMLAVPKARPASWRDPSKEATR